MQVLL
jgi:hypothetical protein